MAARCIALLSSGLDSRLAVRIMQLQGVHVEAMCLHTVFMSRHENAAAAARELAVPLTTVEQDEAYLDLLRRPRFGFGKGANPCVDCRIYMLQKAKGLMKQAGAHFVVSGEVLGQRPMSQKRRDLEIIAHHCGLEDLLVRPLSARLLPPTAPERCGWVRREKLYDFSGRSRQGLKRLAEELGVQELPSPSSGCVLTQPGFARKVFDLLKLQPENQRWDFELLRIGRHFRLDPAVKVVVGRRKEENDQLELMHQSPHASSSALLMSENFDGPVVLVIGPATDAALRFAGGLLFRYSNDVSTDSPLTRIIQRGRTRIVAAAADEAAQQATTVATG